MKEKKTNPKDKINIRPRKGTWKRYLKLFLKCRLPWVWLGLYVILSMGFINLGISETDYTAQLFAGDTSPLLLTKLITVLVINLLGSSLTVFVGAVTSARINRNMRTAVFHKVVRLPMSFFKDENPREAIYRIVHNSTVIDNSLMFVIIPMFSAAYTMVAIFRKVFKYDWRLSLVMLAFIPLVVLNAWLFGRLNFSVSERDSGLNAKLEQKLSEMINIIPLTKAFAKEEQETARGEELTGRLYHINIVGSWIGQFKDLSETALSLIQSIAIAITGVVLLQGESITKRAWIAFFLFSSLFMGAVNTFTMIWNNLKNIQGGADRVAEIMNAPEEKRDGIPVNGARGDICFSNVAFGYEEEKQVLKDVSCRFRDQTVTALLGVSGCGKTTLVNLIARLYMPGSGSICIGEQNIWDYALEDYRSQFVLVSQNSMLFSGTIRENLCYGNEEVSETVLLEALKKAGAYDFVKKLPNGLNTRLEEYGNNLSGGQRQRLAVARALLSDAPYFILDEPVAAIDAIATAELMDILKDAVKGRCVIVIAHSAAILPLVQRVVVLEAGRVSAEGALDEVMEQNSFLREFVGKEVAE